MSGKRKTPPPSVEKDGDDAVFLSELYQNKEFPFKTPEDAKAFIAYLQARREEYLSQRLTNERLEDIHTILHEFHELSGDGAFMRGILALAVGKANGLPAVHHENMAANARNGIWAAEAVTSAESIQEAASLGFLIGQSLANCRALQRDKDVIQGLRTDPKTVSKRERKPRNQVYWNQIRYAWNDYCEDADSPVPNENFFKWLKKEGDIYEITVTGQWVEENPYIEYLGTSIRWETIRKKINHFL